MEYVKEYLKWKKANPNLVKLYPNMLDDDFLNIVMGPFEKQMERLEAVGYASSDDKYRQLYLPNHLFKSQWGEDFKKLRKI